jgi:hypothetical protein
MGKDVGRSQRKQQILQTSRPQSINIDCSLRRNLLRLCGSLADVADLPELEKPQH